MKETIEKKPNKWLVAVLVLGALFVISIFAAAILVGSSDNNPAGNVAVIPLEGVIMTESSNSLFSASDVASATDTIRLINEAVNNPSVKAIVIKIDSPGGAPVASDEIVLALKQAKLNKTTVAWIRETGASGAYWVASSTDHIIAHPLSITGSIGVNAAYIDFSGLMQKYGVNYNQVIGGKYKDIGSPFTELTPEERKIFQAKIDLLHEYFIKDVASNRNLSYTQVKSAATGIFYLGAEAKDLGLVDELGGEAEVKAYLEKKLNVKVTFAEYRVRHSLLDALSDFSSSQSYQMGRGFGSAMFEKSDSGKLMLQ